MGFSKLNRHSGIVSACQGIQVCSNERITAASTFRCGTPWGENVPVAPQHCWTLMSEFLTQCFYFDPEASFDQCRPVTYYKSLVFLALICNTRLPNNSLDNSLATKWNYLPKKFYTAYRILKWKTYSQRWFWLWFYGGESGAGRL